MASNHSANSDSAAADGLTPAAADGVTPAAEQQTQQQWDEQQAWLDTHTNTQTLFPTPLPQQGQWERRSSHSNDYSYKVYDYDACGYQIGKHHEKTAPERSYS